MKGVQCYELLGGIALKIHTFSFSFFQWDKANNVHRYSLFTNRERNIDNYIAQAQTYHPTTVSTNKSVIKEWIIALSTQRNIYFVIRQCALMDNRLILRACW